MEARVKLARTGPPAHMSEHVSERLTFYPTELARQTDGTQLATVEFQKSLGRRRWIVDLELI